MSDFNLAALIEAQLADGKEPKDAADAIVDQLTPSELREALRLVLPQYVRITIGRNRLNRHRPRVREPALIAAGDRRERAAAEIAAEVAERAETIRSSMIAVPSEEGWTYMALGELTVPDLLAIADHRRKVAKENEAAADMYDGAASELLDSGADTLADLDDDTLVRLLG